ncbi:uncharacterized protein [Littorina saxatilis]|uniref:uncharacterized protein isoform X1 n=1 Tax=Littorina saxatilis TaxID=31220 RepID=UPI0038B5B548
MLRHWSVAVVLCVVGGMTWTDVRGWEQHSISCDFDNGQCGWKDGENTTLHWTQDSNIAGDHYMALDMDSAQVNDTGLLFSPMLHGSVNQTCKLSFIRHIKNDNRACQLSVFLVTETTWTLMWRTVDVTGEGLFVASWNSETSPGLQRPCTDPSFQIVFEGRKITSESCGGTVDVDDIVFEFSQPDITPPLLTQKTTSVPTTQLSTGNTHVDTDTKPSVNSTAPDNSQTNNPTEAYSAEDSDSGVSTAVITAVVAIILAVVIIICLILIVFFLRRRAQKQGKTDHWTLHLFRTQKTPSRPHGASAVFTNSQDVPYSGQGQANPESADQARIQSGGHRASVHLYSTAEDHRYSTLDYPRDEHRYGTVDNHHYGTLDDHRDEHRYSTLQTDIATAHQTIITTSHQQTTCMMATKSHHLHTTDRQDGACTSNHDYYNA